MISGRADDVGRVLLVCDMAGKAALSVLTVLVLLAGAVPAAQAQGNTVTAVERASMSRAKGKEGAPLFVYEIADFACPHCAEFALDVFPAIDSAYVQTGKVHWVFVSLPLPNHRNAWVAHEAAVCAGAVADLFWPMHDRVFGTQEEWVAVDDPGPIFARLGKEAGVPAEALSTCMAGDQVSQLLLQDVIFAASARVNGTPAFIVNNEQSVMGLKTFAEWQELLDKMLKAKGDGDDGSF